MIELQDSVSPSQLADAVAPAAYTVAQLAALPAADRRQCVYCTDCLTPEGTGSPVVWTGTAWVCTCSGMPVTTDLMTFFRALASVGKEHASSAGAYYRQGIYSSLSASVPVGTGASASLAYDLASSVWQTGTDSGGGSVRDQQYINGVDFGTQAVYQGAVLSAAFAAETTWFGALSTAALEYSYRRGFIPTVGTALSSNEACFVVDRGNALGIGNTTNSPNWFAMCRAGSVWTVVNTGVAPATSFGGRQELSILLLRGSCVFTINGVNVATITTNVPSDATARAMQAGSVFVKTVGAAHAYRYVRNRGAGVRF